MDTFLPKTFPKHLQVLSKFHAHTNLPSLLPAQSICSNTAQALPRGPTFILIQVATPFPLCCVPSSRAFKTQFVPPPGSLSWTFQLSDAISLWSVLGLTTCTSRRHLLVAALYGHHLLTGRSGLNAAWTLPSYVTRAISATVLSLDFLCSHHLLSCDSMSIWSRAAMHSSTGGALHKPRVRCLCAWWRRFHLTRDVCWEAPEITRS